MTPSRRTLGALLVAVSAGLVVGLLLVPTTPGPGDDQKPMPEARFLGQKLLLDDQARRVSLSRARRYLSEKFSLLLPDGKKEIVYKGALGVELDRVHLDKLLRQAADRTSPMIRVFRAHQGHGPLLLSLPTTLNRQQALPTLLRLKDRLDRLPVDARLDLEKRTLVPEQHGRLLDVDASLAAIEKAIRAGHDGVALVFLERRATRLASQLGNVEFGQVLGFFETPYDRSSRYEARTYNLRQAASRLDGTVLLPGEIFDFNEVVGPRDEANGYKVAPVIAQGEVVDGIGGGTCQISGTLHGAAFFAGLEIAERYPHTRPSSYIKLGLDATVVYPTINFRIKNNFQVPVVLHETVKNGKVRAEILGPERLYTVTLIRRIHASIPYEEVERPDKRLLHGERVLAQRGVPGFRLKRYRIVRKGLHAVRERWDDVYPPTTQIVRVGTAEPANAEKADDDPHGEYLADELLVVTQGPDPDESDDGVMRESREPGRFGVPGWTEELGMPFYRGREKAGGQARASPGSAEKKPEKS